ncbi:MAG: ATP-dependent protease ATPase subunit HslU [Clostridiales bacterium]|jgi:ATP-dependent HslUV protease ATP-binding subunit HslU|nr:ATP-dependent protease ATPase subunit HslU [Clostridiales bacterium]
MLTPKQIVDALDKYIVGQDKAKRAVAIALRNRYRRSKLSEELREEITPKNIIMIGPTGVGKTEIARRFAKLVDAPLIKVEATKFTEVGYVGRDVDSMVRDLVEASIRLCKASRMENVRMMAETAAEQRLVDLLVPLRKSESKVNPMAEIQRMLGMGQQPKEPEPSEEEKRTNFTRRETVLAQLRAQRLEDEIVEIEVEEKSPGSDAMIAMGIDISTNDILGSIFPKKKKKRKVAVREARRILVQEESDRLIDMDEVTREAIEKAEQDGIIFIDEIDKIASPRGGTGGGPEVSREGVQRDILPIVEGSTVSTKYGPVKTDYILFIAAGAFHVAKVEDLIPELQGRFPIRVELNALTEEDYRCILTQPENAITKQYAALLGADNVLLQFEEDALNEIARYAHIANETTENIGARRLHTVMETLLEDISFNAGGDYPDVNLNIDAAYVRDRMAQAHVDTDLRKYIL